VCPIFRLCVEAINHVFSDVYTNLKKVRITLPHYSGGEMDYGANLNASKREKYCWI
jgi:hypothetical protein